MGPTNRTLDSGVYRDIAGVLLTIVLVGVSYGAIAHNGGFAWWQSVLMASLVLGGASEMTFVGVVAAGGVPLVGALAAVLVNTRNFAFGLSLSGYAPRGWRSWLAAHLLNDEATAVGRAQPADPQRWRAFLITGVGVLIAWPIGAIIGQFAGQVIDAQALGLDVAFPIIMFCLVVQALRASAMALGVTLGMAAALALTPVVPQGLAILGGLLGLPVVSWLERRAA